MNRRFRVFRLRKRSHLNVRTFVSDKGEPSEFGAAARGYEGKPPPGYTPPVVRPRGSSEPQAWPADKGQEGGRCNNGKCLKPLRPGVLHDGAHWCEKCARLLGVPA